MRTMEQCVLTSPGTIAFCLHMVWTTALFFTFPRSFPSSWPGTAPLHSCLLDVSRLLGLTLRPSAPVFRCHPEAFDTLEAGICAGSRAWYFSFVFPFVFLDGESAKTEFSDSFAKNFCSKVADSKVSCFSSPNLFFALYTIQCASHVHSLSIVDHVIGISLDTLENMITTWCLDRHPIASRSPARCCTHLCFPLDCSRTTSAYFLNCETLCGDMSRMRAILAYIFSR